MRHAKSSWDGDEADHDRPLNERGRRDAPRVAARLVELGWSPDFILSSDSTRTVETHALMRVVLPAAPVLFLRGLYHGSAGSLRKALAGVERQFATVLALGHNPGWEHAVADFSGEHVTMKTASAALLECDAPDWTTAAMSEWKLVAAIHPREIHSEDAG